MMTLALVTTSKKSALAVALASAFVLTACGGGSNNSPAKPNTTPTTPVEQPKPDPKPEEPKPEEPKPQPEPALPAATSTDPEAGTLLKGLANAEAQFGDNPAMQVFREDLEQDLPIVRLYSLKNIETEAWDRTIEYGVKKGGTGNVFFAGLREIYYDEAGNFEGVLAGSRRPVMLFRQQVAGRSGAIGGKFEYLTSYRANDGFDATDAGLKVGGQYAGVYASNNSDSYFLRDPAVAKWNYQTYASFNATGNIEAVGTYQSIGSSTPTLPTEGKGEYQGISTGTQYTYADANADQPTLKLIASTIVATGDFGKKTLDVNIGYSKLYNLGAETTHEVSDNHNLTGQVTWDSVAQSYTGTVTSKDGRLKGEVKLRFYGANADEVGGVFGVSNSDNTINYLGAFGARR